MNINSEDWVTSGEAARLLSVSPQRITQLADEGALESLSPWPHIRLIERRSVANRLAGHRLERPSKVNAARWVTKRSGVRYVDDIDVNVLRELLLEFIVEARPRMPKADQDLWALNMASDLHAKPPPRTATWKGTPNAY